MVRGAAVTVGRLARLPEGHPALAGPDASTFKRSMAGKEGMTTGYVRNDRLDPVSAPDTLAFQVADAQFATVVPLHMLNQAVG